MSEHGSRDSRSISALVFRRLSSHGGYALGACCLSLLGALLTFLVAIHFFPYHSLNHDEAVYLQQAAMLLDGKLVLRPPVVEAFRPWFFVRGPHYLYPKYAPVPAAIFALGLALGIPRLALAAVAATIAFLTYVVVAETFSRRTGFVAAAFVCASPLFVIDTAVFLPYAPTAALELAFAASFLRADRLADRRRWGPYAAIAGATIGLAFFARPFTALLFAAPFVVYALFALADRSRNTRLTATKWAVVAVFGLCGVALTLAYNAALTGSALRFPYEVFAPHDGLGFGYHEILGYEVLYTPELALRANARVLAVLLTDWLAGGPLGSVLTFCGLAALARRAVRRRGIDPRQAAVLGVVPSVVLGNLLFWGNLNVLGALSAPGDGLIRFLGPYYHFDLLLPASACGAYGALWGFDRLRAISRARLAPSGSRAVPAVAVLVVCAGVAGGSLAASAPHVAANAGVTDRYEQAYAPVENRALGNALVFVPEPYGPWLNHPFQYLRNDPDYEDGPIYALEERPFAVLDAFPNREVYRYTYRGGWTPVSGPAVTPRLQSVETVAGDRIVLHTVVGIPASADRVSIRLATDDAHAYYAVRDGSNELPLRVVLGDGNATVRGPVSSVGASSVPIGVRADVAITVFVDYGAGTGFSYDLVLPVVRESTGTAGAAETNGTGEADTARLRALSPTIERCFAPLHCGGGAAYVPSEHPPGITVETRLVANTSASPAVATRIHGRSHATRGIDPRRGRDGNESGRTARPER